MENGEKFMRKKTNTNILDWAHREVTTEDDKLRATHRRYTGKYNLITLSNNHITHRDSGVKIKADPHTQVSGQDSKPYASFNKQTTAQSDISYLMTSLWHINTHSWSQARRNLIYTRLYIYHKNSLYPTFFAEHKQLSRIGFIFSA